jgi:hypothetical protein
MLFFSSLIFPLFSIWEQPAGYNHYIPLHILFNTFKGSLGSPVVNSQRALLDARIGYNDMEDLFLESKISTKTLVSQIRPSTGRDAMPQNNLDLAGIFQSVTQTLAENQHALNQADDYNGDHGSNMVQTFQTITSALQKKQGSSASTA